MSAPTASRSWFAPPPPAVAVEIATRRVTVAALGRRGGERAVTAHATETLPPGAVRPTLTESNIPDQSVVVDALGRALDRAGLSHARRAALIVPDSAVRVTLLAFEKIPGQAADLDQLVRWQLRKSSPFPIDGARLSYFPSEPPGGPPAVVAIAARPDVVGEYEAVALEAGLQPGVVDVASLNVVNAVIGAGHSVSADWLLVHLAPEATALAIMRGDALMFYRHRSTADGEPFGGLIHQIAMYHQDRLGGGAFSRVFVSGASEGEVDMDDVRRSVSDRLGVSVETADLRGAADLDASDGRLEVLDRLAAPVGLLLREQAAA